MNINSQASPPELPQEISTLELAQALAERLTITPNDWHRLKNNRKAQAGQQLASAFLALQITHLELLAT